MLWSQETVATKVVIMPQCSLTETLILRPWQFTVFVVMAIIISLSILVKMK